MSNRTKQFETATANPATSYLSWKSVNKNFESYDKVAQSKSEKELPLKAIFLKQGSAVKGWNDETSEGIYSNIVSDLRYEDLRVRQGGTTILEGKYADLKPQLQAKDIKFNSKIFAIVDNEVVMITLKGAATGAWFEFAKENEAKLTSHYIEVKEVKDEKKGAVSYSVPVFTVGAKLSAKDTTFADETFDQVESYLAPKVEEIEVEADVIPSVPQPEAEQTDDLPF